MSFRSVEATSEDSGTGSEAGERDVCKALAEQADRTRLAFAEKSDISLITLAGVTQW